MFSAPKMREIAHSDASCLLLSASRPKAQQRCAPTKTDRSNLNETPKRNRINDTSIGAEERRYSRRALPIPLAINVVIQVAVRLAAYHAVTIVYVVTQIREQEKPRSITASLESAVQPSNIVKKIRGTKKQRGDKPLTHLQNA